MKKLVGFTLTLTILALLFAFLPTQAAFADKAGHDASLSIRNRTGAPVWITLINPDGKRQTFQYEPGLFESLVLQGKYTYYIHSVCGTRTGVLNLDNARQFYLSCTGGELTFGDSNPNGWYTAPSYAEPTPVIVPAIVPAVVPEKVICSPNDLANGCRVSGDICACGG